MRRLLDFASLLLVCVLAASLIRQQQARQRLNREVSLWQSRYVEAVMARCREPLREPFRDSLKVNRVRP